MAAIVVAFVWPDGVTVSTFLLLGVGVGGVMGGLQRSKRRWHSGAAG